MANLDPSCGVVLIAADNRVSDFRCRDTEVPAILLLLNICITVRLLSEFYILCFYAISNWGYPITFAILYL